MDIGFTLDEAFEKVGMPIYFQHVLKTCYSQEHRYYHNIDHVCEMLKWVPKNHPEVEIIIDAILFHDIVQYQPAPIGMSEALSVAEFSLYTAKLMSFDTPFGKEEEDLGYEYRVIEAIVATGRHTEDQKDLSEVSKWVLDLDLSTFALPWSEYIVWKEKIEQENLALYPDRSPEDIKKGRHQFLQTLLDRQQLYYIHTAWEEPARENIQKDLNYEST